MSLKKSITIFREFDPYMPSQQIDLLLALYLYAPMRSGELQIQCDMQKPACSRNLISLEEKGLVTMIAADPNDLRTKDIQLTKLGRELVESAV